MMRRPTLSEDDYRALIMESSRHDEASTDHRQCGMSFALITRENRRDSEVPAVFLSRVANQAVLPTLSTATVIRAVIGARAASVSLIEASVILLD